MDFGVSAAVPFVMPVLPQDHNSVYLPYQAQGKECTRDLKGRAQTQNTDLFDAIGVVITLVFIPEAGPGHLIYLNGIHYDKIDQRNEKEPFSDLD